MLERARFLGWVDNSLLEALYANARAVILPKTLGGGSNLKTAEALAKNRPIVATELAFQGFETFANLPAITIANEPNEFWGAVDSLLSGPVAATTRSMEAMNGLLWHECMKPMVHAAKDLLGGPATGPRFVGSGA